MEAGLFCLLPGVWFLTGPGPGRIRILGKSMRVPMVLAGGALSMLSGVPVVLRRCLTMVSSIGFGELILQTLKSRHFLTSFFSLNAEAISIPQP